MYGNELYEYLKGNDCDGVFIGPDHFLTIGLIMIGISLLVFIAYYYLINHPRYNRWYHWGTFLFLTGIFNLFIGFGYTYSKLNGGNIPACFTYSQIEATDDGSIFGVDGTEILFNSNCWQFGLANAIIAIAFFIIFTFAFKWWSRNCKHSPLF